MASLKKNELDLWLWDGASEYEGLLLKLQEASFSARVRQVRRGAPLSGALGKRVPGTTLDVHRQFTERKFLAHVKGTIEGTLFEAVIDSVQTSQDGDFEHLIAGRFAALDEKQLDLLRKMSVENAATLMQRQVG